MTVLGKLLVFVNLVFSVVVGGLVVVVFTARTNYADRLQRSEDFRKMDQGAAQAKMAEANTIKAEYEAKLAEEKAARGKVEKDLATVLANYKSLDEKMAADKLDRNEIAVVKQKSQLEVQRLIAAEAAASKRTDNANTQISDLVKEKAKLTDAALTAQVEASALLAQTQRLEKIIQQQYKDLARLQSGPVTPAAGASLTTKNPPPEKIDGQVVQASGELLKLSVGSDSGLKQGHTMELFRLGAKPLYLGTVRIISLEAKGAVAKPIDRLLATPQVGDTVSSRIGS